MASQENQAAAETSRSEGNEFFKKKQVDEAIAAYTKSIDLSPDSSNAALCSRYLSRSLVRLLQYFCAQQRCAKAGASIKGRPLRLFCSLGPAPGTFIGLCLPEHASVS